MGVVPACGGYGGWSNLWKQARLDSVLKCAWPACGGCDWSYLWKAGKAELCSEEGVVGMWWVRLVLPVEGRQGWTLF